LLKSQSFSGRNPDGRNCFSAAYAQEKPNSPRMSPNLILTIVLRSASKTESLRPMPLDKYF